MRECEYCGNSLEGRKVTARYCDGGCRSAAARGRKAQEGNAKGSAAFWSAIGRIGARTRHWTYPRGAGPHEYPTHAG